MNTTMNTATASLEAPVSALIPASKGKRGRPKLSALSTKECRARIRALGGKPYGADCLKLGVVALNAYVADLERKQAAH